MKKSERIKKEKQLKKLLGFIAGFILLSGIFMILVIPGAYSETIPGSTNTRAAIAISIAATLRFVFFFWILWMVNKISTIGLKRKINDYALAIGISILLLGLVYLDGAMAFTNNEPKYISALMLFSIICDLFAVILSLIIFFTNRSQK